MYPAGRSAPAPTPPRGFACSQRWVRSQALSDGCVVRQPQWPRSSAEVCPGFSWEVAAVDEPSHFGFLLSSNPCLLFKVLEKAA